MGFSGNHRNLRYSIGRRTSGPSIEGFRPMEYGDASRSLGAIVSAPDAMMRSVMAKDRVVRPSIAASIRGGVVCRERSAGSSGRGDSCQRRRFSTGLPSATHATVPYVTVPEVDRWLRAGVMFPVRGRRPAVTVAVGSDAMGSEPGGPGWMTEA